MNCCEKNLSLCNIVRRRRWWFSDVTLLGRENLTLNELNIENDEVNETMKSLGEAHFNRTTRRII